MAKIGSPAHAVVKREVQLSVIFSLHRSRWALSGKDKNKGRILRAARVSATSYHYGQTHKYIYHFHLFVLRHPLLLQEFSIFLLRFGLIVIPQSLYGYCCGIFLGHHPGNSIWFYLMMDLLFSGYSFLLLLNGVHYSWFPEKSFLRDNFIRYCIWKCGYALLMLEWPLGLV